MDPPSSAVAALLRAHYDSKPFTLRPASTPSRPSMPALVPSTTAITRPTEFPNVESTPSAREAAALTGPVPQQSEARLLAYRRKKQRRARRQQGEQKTPAGGGAAAGAAAGVGSGLRGIQAVLAKAPTFASLIAPSVRQNGRGAEHVAERDAERDETKAAPPAADGRFQGTSPSSTPVSLSAPTTLTRRTRLVGQSRRRR